MALAYALDPLAKHLTKRGVSRLAAALIILGGFVVALVVLVLLVAPVLAQQVSSLDGQCTELCGEAAKPRDPFECSLAEKHARRCVGSGNSTSQLVNKITDYFSQFLVSIWTTGRALISIFSLLIITPVVAFYLICDWDGMISALDRLIPLSQRDTVRGLCREIDATLSSYVRGQSARLPHPRLVLCGGAHADGLELRLADRVVSGLITSSPMSVR